MLNYLWGFLIIIGVIYAALTGHMAEVTNGALDSSKEAVSICITMLGVMSLWTGLMQIAQKAGIISSFTRKIRPLLRWLFPDVPQDNPAIEYIATNLIADFLGLGWASTPAGLKAIKELAKLNKKDVHTASDAMCTFLIINISSIQLIPVIIIAYSSQYGSVNPAAIIVPGLIATTVSTIAAIIFCKIKCHKSKNFNK